MKAQRLHYLKTDIRWESSISSVGDSSCNEPPNYSRAFFKGLSETCLNLRRINYCQNIFQYLEQKVTMFAA